MTMRTIFTILAAAFLASCASEGYTPYASTPGAPTNPRKEYDQVTIQRTACRGFCPVYKVTVDERDVLLFEGERFVAEEGGAVSKRLPEGSFRKLIAIAREHGFSGFDKYYPNEAEDNCPAMATDMPAAIVTIDSRRLTHQVHLYQGCMGFEGRERLDEMLLAMDAVMNIGDWIGEREQFYGGEQ